MGVEHLRCLRLAIDFVQLSISKSVVPGFQTARFDYDDTYQEFAKKFDLKPVILRCHHDIPAQHAGGLLETQDVGWNVGPPVVDGTVSIGYDGYDSQSYSDLCEAHNN